MHTAIVLGIGFGLLAVTLVVGRVLGGAFGMATAAPTFLPLWFTGASINLYLGVKRAGYSVAGEAPIFCVVFSIPALAALLSWWRLR